MTLSKKSFQLQCVAYRKRRAVSIKVQDTIDPVQEILLIKFAYQLPADGSRISNHRRLVVQTCEQSITYSICDQFFAKPIADSSVDPVRDTISPSLINGRTAKPYAQGLPRF
jgi:hypothetical protein